MRRGSSCWKDDLTCSWLSRKSFYKTTVGVRDEGCVICLGTTLWLVDVLGISRIIMIAYGERCQIRDLWRRKFHFGTENTASVTQSFTQQTEWVKSLSGVRLFATSWTVAHQAPPSMGFSRQEHWSGLPLPSPMQESEKWSHSVVSDLQWPQGLQPSRLLHPWDFPGKSTAVGFHCLLPNILDYLYKH